MTPPAPLGPTTYDNDAVGGLVEVTDGNGDTTTYEYDAADRVTRTTVNGVTATIRLYRDDGTVRYERDEETGTAISYGYNVLLGKPIWQTTNSPLDLGIETTVNLTYDPNGNLRIVKGAYASGPYEYRYDAANQLIKAGPQGGCPSDCVSFTYDDNGNETSRLFPGGGRQDTDRDASVRPTRITATDVNGAVRADVGYTQAGDDRTVLQTRTSHREGGIPHETATYGDRLQVTANGPTGYTTFGHGNTRQLTAGTTNYLHTDQGLVRKATGTATDYIRDANGSAIYNQRLVPSYCVTDHLGSVLGSFNDNGTWQGGYSYSPYGERRSTGTTFPIASNNLRFAGGYEESPNLYKLGARYYDATLGRFTQADPTGQEPNPYTYAAANPCNNTDPTGTATCAGAVFQAVLSAAGLAFATMSLVTLTAATGGWALVGILAGFEIAILSAPFSVRNLIESC
ncbi:RHS repeat-associated core domain-containing protein [Georgenia halophila]|uniref:RHS repeat-associated core domain-containing protein n=1 Tax=Georgenia halophila TaxID=620889 RepID=UPI0031F00E47